MLGGAASGLCYFFFRSVLEIQDGCDFEVFWYTAKRLLHGEVDLYEFATPVKGRLFLYPPSAGILISPLGLVPEAVAGVLWSLLKTGVLAALLWFSVASASRSRSATLGLALVTAVLTLQPITSDFGNGQINLVVMGLVVLGVAGLMSPRLARVGLGAVALAAAVALKATPALFLLLPLVQRRWKASILALVATLVLVVLLPAAWYGPAQARTLFGTFAEISSGIVEGAAHRDRQVSLNELVLFTIAQASERRPLHYDADERETYLGEGESRVRVEMTVPLTPANMRWVWLVPAAAVLLLALLARHRAHRGVPSWPWDLALLSLLVLMLAPMTRRAHLVVLIVPVGWLVQRFVSGSARARSPVTRGLAALTLLFLWASKHVPVHWPASFPMPYHPTLFLSLVGLILLVFRMGDAEPTDDLPRDHSIPRSEPLATSC